jgi:hypothetical protein
VVGLRTDSAYKSVPAKGYSSSQWGNARSGRALERSTVTSALRPPSIPCT